MTPCDKRQHVEVVIIGSGMVGSLLSIALCPYVKSILLLDKVAHDTQRDMVIDSRPLSLNQASLAALKSLTLWPILQPYAVPIERVHVSQQGYLGTTQFSHVDYNLEQLGMVVPADVLAITLLKKALELDNVTFQKIEEIGNIEQKEQKVFLSYKSDHKIIVCDCDFLFGCDGSHSNVAQYMNAQYVKEGDTLYALVCDLYGANLNGIAYERFTEKGTLALLPKLKQAAGVVFTGKKEVVDELVQLDDDAFVHEIQRLMGDRLPTQLSLGKRFVKALESSKHVPQSHKNILLLGNAARTLYPIAAQGFNLGLRDVMQLQAVFACAKDMDMMQAEKIIETFLKLRHEDQDATSELTKKIGDVFEKPGKVASHCRGIGLMGLDLLQPLKNKIADRALGISGQVKRVLKLVSDESY